MRSAIITTLENLAVAAVPALLVAGSGLPVEARLVLMVLCYPVACLITAGVRRIVRRPHGAARE